MFMELNNKLRIINVYRVLKHGLNHHYNIKVSSQDYNTSSLKIYLTQIDLVKSSKIILWFSFHETLSNKKLYLI